MDTAQWPQEIVVKPMEETIVAKTCSYVVTTTTSTCSNVISNNNNIKKNMSCSSSGLERKVRPEKDQAVNCPRCNSTNTKFCYYNNYSLTQPRYLCKTCKRYWTEGGSLRNIPVGGGSRKNKRSSSNSSSLISPSKKLNSQSHHDLNLNPKNMTHDHQGGRQDHLNMGFPQTHQEFRSLSEFIQLPNIETTPNKTQMLNSAATSSTANHLSAMELLNGLKSSRGLTIPFIATSVPDSNAVYSSGFPSLQDFKPSLSFSLDGIGIGNRYDMSLHLQEGGVQQVQETNNGRLLFPFEGLKHASSNTSTADHLGNNTANEQTRHHGSSAGYWTGMLDTSEGSWIKSIEAPLINHREIIAMQPLKAYIGDDKERILKMGKPHRYDFS